VFILGAKSIFRLHLCIYVRLLNSANSIDRNTVKENDALFLRHGAHIWRNIKIFAAPCHTSSISIKLCPCIDSWMTRVEISSLLLHLATYFFHSNFLSVRAISVAHTFPFPPLKHSRERRLLSEHTLRRIYADYRA
jgi:hypothetical protein